MNFDAEIVNKVSMLRSQIILISIQPFLIRTDASGTGVAGAVYQLDAEQNPRPICFVSRVLLELE